MTASGGSRSLVLHGSIVVAIALAVSHSVCAAPAYQGMSYTSFGKDVLGTSASDQSLLNLSLVGTDTVAVNFWWFQPTTAANSMAEDFARYSSTQASVAHAIDTIHNLGMKVMLKPMLDVADESGTWRAYIDPSNKTQWFANYTNFLGTFADMAQSKGVELFSIGCEMNTLEQAANNTNWTSLISNVRSRYDGKLTYSANWGAIGANVGGYENVPWWNQLDYIGIDAYFPLSNQNATTLAGLTSSWQALANNIENWRSNRGLTDKQVIFTEVGYPSFDGGTQTPWGGNGPVDLQEQADAYQSLLSVMSTKSWWDGAFWWSWETNPNAGGTGDAGFTPQRKLAENVLASNYGGTATVFRGVPSQTLFSWEDGTEGWSTTGFSAFPVAVDQSSSGVTAGEHSLAISQTVPTNGVNHFSWDAKVSLAGDALAALSGALKDGATNYRVELDVTIDPEFIPQSGLTWLDTSIAFNNDNGANGWSQVDGLTPTNGHTNQTIHVSVPLSSWTGLSANSPWYELIFGFNGNWAGTATVFLDNLRLVNLTAPLSGDFNGDGRVDAADYTVWRNSLGSTSDLRADGNLNGVVDLFDYQMWKSNFGATLSGSSSGGVAAPEPTVWISALAGMMATLACRGAFRRQGVTTVPRQ
jgi:Glycoside Hydrolase Family 113/Dockerin type I domain